MRYFLILLLVVVGCSYPKERRGVVVEQGTISKAVFYASRFGSGGWREVPVEYTKIKLDDGREITIKAKIGKINEPILIDVDDPRKVEDDSNQSSK